MRKMFLATASAAALTLSVSAFAQDTGTTPVVPAPTVGNDQAGQTPDITNDRGQTQPSGGSTVNSTTGEITGADQGGSVGVDPRHQQRAWSDAAQRQQHRQQHDGCRRPDRLRDHRVDADEPSSDLRQLLRRRRRGTVDRPSRGRE